MTAVASTPQELVIATRASQLALWQAKHVRDRLQQLYPQCKVSLLEMTTRGDQILDRTLSKWVARACLSKSWKPPCSMAVPIWPCTPERRAGGVARVL